MVRRASLFSQLVALFSHRQSYGMVKNMALNVIQKDSAPGVTLLRCCSLSAFSSNPSLAGHFFGSISPLESIYIPGSMGMDR